RETGASAEAEQTLAELEALVGRGGLNDAELLWMAGRALASAEAERALGYLDPVLAGRPGSAPEARAEASYLAGRAQRALGQRDEAITSFERVIAMGRGFDLLARLELARTLADSGQPEGALAAFAGLINAESSEVAAHALFDSAQVCRRLAEGRRRQG